MAPNSLIANISKTVDLRNTN